MSRHIFQLSIPGTDLTTLAVQLPSTKRPRVYERTVIPARINVSTTHSGISAEFAALPGIIHKNFIMRNHTHTHTQTHEHTCRTRLRLVYLHIN